jgi:hypothetical protein
MWEMGLQYCDAMVYQAKVHQAKKVYENDDVAVEDSVKSAMSPFLVLDVRRDNLIEDTLDQVRLKVNKYKLDLTDVLNRIHKQMKSFSGRTVINNRINFRKMI